MINKDKKVNLQISMPKDTASQLQAIVDAFRDEGVNITKSEILTQAFKEYLERILMINEFNKQGGKRKC